MINSTFKILQQNLVGVFGLTIIATTITIIAFTFFAFHCFNSKDFKVVVLGGVR